MANILQALISLYSIFSIIYPPPTPRQIHNIIEAHMASRDFAKWAGTLTATDPDTFPVNATIFIPSLNPKQALSHLNKSSIDPASIAYHIVPEWLVFSELQSYEVGSHLPTLIPLTTLTITNNSTLGFTINGVKITHPDFFVDGLMVVHIVESTLYNNQVPANNKAFINLILDFIKGLFNKLKG